jgi:hypothetical protein
MLLIAMPVLSDVQSMPLGIHMFNDRPSAVAKYCVLPAFHRCTVTALALYLISVLYKKQYILTEGIYTLMYIDFRRAVVVD